MFPRCVVGCPWGLGLGLRLGLGLHLARAPSSPWRSRGLTLTMTSNLAIYQRLVTGHESRRKRAPDNT